MSTPESSTAPSPEGTVPERTLTDAAVLRAFAHPTRLRILALLRAKGACKVSTISDEIDEAIGSVSHHLKPLEAAGLVERAPELAQDKRETWWRTPPGRTSWNRADMTPDAAHAALQAEELMLARQFDLFRQAMHEPMPDEWKDSPFAMSSWLQLTPSDLVELNRHLDALVETFRARSTANRESASPEARSVLFAARGILAQP